MPLLWSVSLDKLISSFFLNPGEANHGDLGQIDKRDLFKFMNSGMNNPKNYKKGRLDVDKNMYFKKINLLNYQT